ncbi:MAG TPA: hypothetical protein VNI01_11240 [Elusimicrobiota bacterium]|jgi:hypothetical protein|nr:hypothetical protein [Elusimicrobiota bacterium]
MPPPSVTIVRARGAGIADAGTDFRMAIIGASSLAPWGTGVLSTLYGDPDALALDAGIGDGVDAAYHALARTDDNPNPPALAFLSTLGLSSTALGVRGSLTTSGVTGSTTVTATASTYPLGTFEPRVRVVDDGNNGAGCVIGVEGIVLQGSVNNGRDWLPTSRLGTDTTWKLQLPNPGGSPIDTGVQYDFSNGSGETLKTGDFWYESKTTPPQFAVADLYTAGSPGTGALMTIARAAFNVGLVVVTEPVAAGDIATLKAGLTAMAALRASCRPSLIVRFRDQAAGESDVAYVAAFQEFRAACADDERICVWAGDGWLTDAQRSYVYSRSGLPSFLAKLQGMSVLAGPKGERIAQSPGMTSRGPLVGFSIHDTAGNPVGHDERTHPGILGPLAGKGGGACAYYEAADRIAGTYACVQTDTLCPVLPATQGVQSLMDNRVSSACERALYNISFLALGGADVVTDFILDDDTREAMAAAGMKAIKDAGLENEFANANDPNLLTVDALVTVDGTLNGVTWRFNNKLYRYTNSVTVWVANARG